MFRRLLLLFGCWAVAVFIAGSAEDDRTNAHTIALVSKKIYDYLTAGER